MPAYGSHVADLLERQPAGARDFTELSQQWRRLFAVCLAAYDAGALTVTANTTADTPDGGTWSTPST